ncbi:MAG: hypothetical protein AB3N20_14625 [Rhizobiaceae bacterium]
MTSRALAEVLSDFAGNAESSSDGPDTKFIPLKNSDAEPDPAEFVQWPVAAVNQNELQSDELFDTLAQDDGHQTPRPNMAEVYSDQSAVLAETSATEQLEPSKETDDQPDITSNHAEQEIARIREEHAAELEQVRQECADQQLAEFAERFAEAEARLLRQLETGVAKTLADLLGERIAEESLTMVCKWLKARIEQPGLLQVEISGPTELNLKLMRMLGDGTDKYRITEKDSPDIQIDVDGEVLSTRLGEWKKMVEGCLR